MALFHTSKKFFRAVAAGDLATVKTYLDGNPGWMTALTDKKDKKTALHVAAAAGQTAMVKLLLSEGATSYSGDKDNNLALHLAVISNHPETVRELIASDRSYITGHTPARLSPLQYAISGGNLPILRLFLESGKADLTADDPPALYWAVQSGKPECVKLLLAAGADANVPRKIVHRSYDDDYYYSHYSSSSSAKETVTYTSPLQQACISDSAEIARLLLEAGAKFLPAEYPLQTAAHNGNLELASLLLAGKSAAVNGKDAAEKTALHHAAEKNHLALARFLLAQGADRQLADKQGRTALSYAQQFALTEMIDALQGSNLAPALRAASEIPLVAVPAPADTATFVAPWRVVEPAPVPGAPDAAPVAETPAAPAGVALPAAPAGDDTWTREGRTVVHVRDSAAQGRRLTEIFNFETRERVVISENLRLKTETMGPHESFDAITEEALAKALAQFRRLGGDSAEGDVFRNRLGKLKAGPG